MTAEGDRIATFGRLEDGLRAAGDWYLWGPYVTERQWGTVREDYSASGDAWDFFPHDHARSRAYRWGEDGLAGFSDVEQRLCVGLALWNHQDPILKERIFGLTGSQGNHGEDAKEYWWYVDALPSHAWNRWRYHYPQRAFPYGDLVAENARRGRLDPEYELLDTGAFDDDRYWVVEVDYAKADPTDLLMHIRVSNRGPEAAPLSVLPTVWYRNTWSWAPGAEKPALQATNGRTLVTEHPFLGQLEIVGSDDVRAPEIVCCDNETNSERLFGTPNATAYPKDGINDYVVDGAATVNPAGVGTKAAFVYRLEVPAGETVELRVRLRPAGGTPRTARGALGRDFETVMTTRAQEADDYYASLAGGSVPDAEADVMRRAFAGMLWSKQLFAYDVATWLAGDALQPTPPASRRAGRNARWKTFNAFDIMSMPDKWEYPWFAAWDLAFHCVALAHVDAAFAKYQLILLCREWFQHPDGALPAYEWSFDDVNPPVQAWAALEVFAIDGARDVDFLERVFAKLLVNFTWWINQEDADGTNLFEGGFLGLDNIGPIDRDHVPAGCLLEQSDATAWMALYALDMAAIAAVLHRHGRPTSDLVIKFLEHFAQIHDAMSAQDLWDEEDGFYYDRLVLPDGTGEPLRVRSMVGVLPVLASVVLGERTLERTQVLGKQFSDVFGARFRHLGGLMQSGVVQGEPGDRRLLLGVAAFDRVERVLHRLLDEGEFLSPYGLRAVSAWHREHPYSIEVAGSVATIDYEPAESTTAMFGGNSNWRGPVWFPLNYLLVSALDRYGRFFGDGYRLEYPTGSGTQHTLHEVADDVRSRLIATFLPRPDGSRPCFGGVTRFRDDPAWRGQLLFNEYFHGDNGAGLGASHQTGWTGVVADMILRRHGAPIPTITDLLEETDPDHG